MVLDKGTQVSVLDIDVIGRLAVAADVRLETEPDAGILGLGVEPTMGVQIDRQIERSRYVFLTELSRSAPAWAR